MPPKKRQRTSDAAKDHEVDQAGKFKTEPSEVNPAHCDDDDDDDVKSHISHATDATYATYEGEIDHASLDEEENPGIAESPSKVQSTNTTNGPGSYNALKSFNGQVYSGMSIGGSHTWNYDPGVWKETKTEPDLWTINYETKKRRARNAPSGSGAPVGTEYHWLIVAHQYVRKVDANTYETRLEGSKYKLAHKGANSASWSVNTVKGQREREVKLLEDAKRRVEGLPVVHAAEKVKVEKREKGQQRLDGLFAKAQTVNRENESQSKHKRSA